MTKILVIEDEAALRQEIMATLTFEDYEVLGAADGVEGVDSAALHGPDLIICDINMPRLDGYGVLLDLQADADLQAIPFIFLSAKTGLDAIRKGMLLGADDYVTKPFSSLELLQAVRTRLEKKAEQDLHHQNQIETFREALAMEHQERLLHAKLVAMFSHDFRNQLTVIISSATLVRDYANRIGEARRTERLNDIEGSARLLVQMLDDMLDVAQMETGHINLNPEPLDVAQFLYKIVQEFQNIPGETHELQFIDHFADAVQTDIRLLRQIAANLISNAIKYSAAGTEIQITLAKRDPYYVLIVQDHGLGVPEADLSQLFNAFKRGSNVGTIMGTGLGLAIVKQAVELLGGSIQVESHENVGTTFTVALPYVVPQR